MDRRRTTWNRMVVSVLAGCAALAAACGSESPSTDGGSPPPATRAFVHVLEITDASEPRPCQGYKSSPNLLSTFEVTPTGTLRSLTSHKIDGARRVAADPLGRFVYVGRVKELPSLVSSYSVDWTTGGLGELSSLVPETPYLGSCPTATEPKALVATPNELLMSRGGPYNSGIDEGFSIFAVAANGTLEEKPGPYHDFWDTSLWLEPHPSLRVVYADDYRGGIVVLAPRSQDGRLDVIGRASTPGDNGYASGRAITATLAGSCLIATWRDSRQATGGLSSYRVDPTSGLLSPMGTVSGLLPLALAGTDGRVAATTSAELQLYSVNATCDLEQRDAAAVVATGPANEVSGALGFHASGRFLYATDRNDLHVYTISEAGKLGLLQTVAGVHGRVTVAAPPS